jgi:hypothetical protein
MKIEEEKLTKGMQTVLENEYYSKVEKEYLTTSDFHYYDLFLNNLLACCSLIPF